MHLTPAAASGSAVAPWAGDALDWLLRPTGAAVLLREHWERRPLFIARGDPAYYAPLIRREDIETLIATTPVHSRTQMAVTTPDTRGPLPQTAAGLGDINGLCQAYAAGQTMVASHVEERSAPMSRLCRALEAALEARVLSNVFLTPAHAQGFRLHWDNHSTFILQIDGRKRWHLWQPVVQSPLRETAVSVTHEQLGEPADAVLLEAGDLLYVPAGWPHEAFARDRSSLHVTLSLFPEPWVALLRAALDAAAERDSRLRAALPHGFVRSAETRAAMRDEFRALVTAFADSADFAEACTRTRGRLLDSMSPAIEGRLTSLDRVDALTLDARVRRPETLLCAVDAGAGGATIRFPGNHVSGPAPIAEALRFVAAAREPFAVAELPGLSPAHRLQLAQRLIREGVLVVED